MLDIDLRHREIIDVRGRQGRIDAGRRSGNQAIGLMECDSAARESLAPCASSHPFGHPQRRQSQATEQAARDDLLARAQAAPDLLDRNHARPRLRAGSSQGRQSGRSGSAAERVDEHGRIQEQAGHRSAGAARVVVTLSPHPRGGVVVPFVTGVGQATESVFDVVPAPFVLESAPHELGDERATSPRARSPVDLLHEILVQRYV